MNLDWHAVGGWTLVLVSVLVGCIGVDCLIDGLRDVRRGQREYDRRIGGLVALTGVGLLAIAGLLWWASMTLHGW